MIALEAGEASVVLAPEVQPMSYDEHSTMDAWANFVGSGSVGGGRQSVVRSLIQNSWRRSVDGGVDASGAAAPIDQDRDTIDRLLRRNADLIAAARPCFMAVSKMVEGTGAMIVLTDGEGVLVEALGDKATLRSGTDIHLTVGGKWDECSVGTNGIGTALAAGEPVFVHAAEHFCAGIKRWTCAGAPIRDPLDGSVIGVFDLSGHIGDFPAAQRGVRRGDRPRNRAGARAEAARGAHPPP